MLDTNLFGNELKRLGFNFYSGVPCSYLKYLINYAINECEYVMAANEGAAIATAAGAFLGGKKSVVLMQNSGLTNAVSPLVSLNHPFKIPVLGFVSLRGEEGIPDEPQHELMGKITGNLLNLMEIKYEFLSDNIDNAKCQLARADECISNNQSFFFIVKKNIFKEEVLPKNVHFINRNLFKLPKRKNDELPTRLRVLETLSSLKDNRTILLATTGKTGRELYEIEDSANNLYMVGSMGCIGSLGLGLALTKKDKDIIVIDGDGALIMHMGNLGTVGYYQPSNMLHILLDNNSYDSTGGQETVSRVINFVDVAASCGYANSIYVHDISELEYYIRKWQLEKKLTFIYMKISKGSKENLGRPHIKPCEVKDRLRGLLND